MTLGSSDQEVQHGLEGKEKKLDSEHKRTQKLLMREITWLEEHDFQ